MTIAANETSIKWLIDLMHTARREMQANGVENPVFVLFTKNADDRRAVEEIILRHFVSQYGDLVASMDRISLESSSQRASIFTLPEIRSSIMLLDASETDKESP